MTIALWLKALHIMAVVAWMAGMLYLPRLFVYHSRPCPARRRRRRSRSWSGACCAAIVKPAMVATWVFGLGSAWPGGWRDGWLHAKIVLVLLLAYRHGSGALVQGLRRRPQPAASRWFYRIVNEMPTVLFIGIVILVVVKPF